MQDPQAAAQELTRCVKELGFCGALVAGFSQIEEADSAVFYDLPQYRPFWATVQQLDVPFYLHPRNPVPTRQQAYEGHPWLVGSAWGFAVDTSTHALRLMGSGLFDELPKLKLILGHLGEGLPFQIWRVDHRISKNGFRTKANLSMSQYFRENFYFTVSADLRGSQFSRFGCEPESSAVVAGHTNASAAVENRQSRFRVFSPPRMVSSWALVPRRPLEM